MRAGPSRDGLLPLAWGMGMANRRLLPGWRRAVRLYALGLPPEEVARLTGRSPGTLRHLLRRPEAQRLLRRLREEGLKSLGLAGPSTAAQRARKDRELN